MPELPEVEVVRRGLTKPLEGGVITDVKVREARLRWPVAADLDKILRGERVEKVGRRGKYLLLHMQTGVLLVHLGMSGTVRWIAREALPLVPLRKHDHVDVEFVQGLVRYHDPRRFGAIVWHAFAQGDLQTHPLLQGLGIEPLESDWDGRLLYTATRGRTANIKSVLLAGDIVVGVGNIYCSEALFRAGIRPTTAAGRISLRRYHALADQIKLTLTQAVAKGGSTLRDFAGSDGEGGYFQMSHLVYDRAGQACRQCTAPIRQIRQGQRSTFYCPHCQR
jgi:formamidopyrimidine-DNA glycosylase